VVVSRSFDPACVFCRIIAGEAPASVVYRDDATIAFMDIRPVNPGHLLVVPLAHAASLADLPAADGQRMFAVAHHLAGALRQSGIRCDGVNLFLADGAAAGQDVFHTHLHVLPRFAGDGIRVATFGRPPADAPSRGDLEEIAAAVRRALDEPRRAAPLRPIDASEG